MSFLIENLLGKRWQGIIMIVNSPYKWMQLEQLPRPEPLHLRSSDLCHSYKQGVQLLCHKLSQLRSTQCQFGQAWSMQGCYESSVEGLTQYMDKDATQFSTHTQVGRFCQCQCHTCQSHVKRKREREGYVSKWQMMCGRKIGEASKLKICLSPGNLKV